MQQVYLVGSGCLVSITRPHHEDVGHGSEGGQVLNGLVSGAVLSQTNGVVCHHKDGSRLQQLNVLLSADGNTFDAVHAGVDIQ